MTLYLDSSAIVKLVAPEPESAALSRLVEPARRLASSEIARVEVRRAVRTQPDARDLLRTANAILAGLVLIKLDGSLLDAAVAVEPPHLRCLDAIHVAAALGIAASLEAFVTYDRRQSSAAAAAGLNVLSPS